ncbi:hypothetical protein [Lonepinella koalarum]|uniref:Copper(I)-binding protein n=1 Tax=Lonepinella koalarum TaxID=53417 RepID=A0A4R1L051_9PAST|nr:hypothetical protein [Lonepinella koalarum]MDH2926075.1 hypothetical protein [Lonepinella koalarum]TCK71226.1 hypothetical protein EV692_0292 [Lonepinella koalarum]TFJ90952.1 hypothetical protein E0709_01455 [Lonepinella koalarum]
MRLFTSLIVMTLSAFVAIQVSANTTQTASKTTSTNSKQREVSKETLLKRFTQSVSIQYLGAGSGVSSDQQPTVEFKYRLKNVGKEAIKTVHWVSQFTNNGQAVLNLDAPVNFNKNGLKAGQEVEMALPIAVAQLPADFIQATQAKDAHLILSNIAMKIVYTDGARLVVNK